MKALLLPFFLFFATSSYALTCAWTGSAGNGLWNDAANWDCGVIPDANDEVTISLAETITLQSAVSLQALDFNNATLTGTASLTISGLCKISTGKIETVGAIDLNGPFEWNGGTLDGSGAINCNGTTSLAGSGRNLKDRILNLNAGATWSQGAFFMLGNATIVVPAAQTWNITLNAFTIFDNGVANKITINGTIDITGSSIGEIRPSFDLAGTLNSSLNLTCRGGGTINNALITIAAGKTIQLSSQTYTINNSNIQGAGIFEAGSSSTVNFNSGTFTAGLKIRGNFSYAVQITPASLELNGGSFNCAFNLVIPGDFIWKGGTVSGPFPLTINGSTQIPSSSQTNTLDACHLILNGNIDYQSSAKQLSFNNNAILEIGSGATLNKENSQSIFSDGSNNQFFNKGIVNINGSGGNSVQCFINNQGTINTSAACDLTFSGGGNFNNSTITKNDASTISFNSGIFTLDNLTYNSNEALNMIDTLEIAGLSTFNFPIDFNLNSTITGSGTATFLQSYTPAGSISPGNSPGILTINSTLTFQNTTSLDIEILDNSGPGTGHDQLLVTGNTQLGGVLNVSETGSINDDSFVILSCAGGANCLTGTFTNVSLPTPMDADYNIFYSGNAVTLVRANTLPIRLTSFSGKSAQQCNQLTWETAAEVNHAGFQLQRSSDGVRFVDLDFIASSKNSNTSNRYNFVDCELVNDAYYYRLKSIDLDNSFSYSPIIFIQNEKTLALQLIGTLLTTGSDLEIAGAFTGELSLHVIDQTGRIVQQSILQKTSYREYIPLQYLTPGMYFLNMTKNGKYYNSKFIVTNNN